MIPSNRRGDAAAPSSAPAYAGFNARVLASMLDTVILPPLAYPFLWLLEKLLGYDEYRKLFRQELQYYGPKISLAEIAQILDTHSLWLPLAMGQLILPMLCLAIIALLFWNKMAATPGKYLLRLTIIDARSGEHPGMLQYTVRMLGYLISALPLGLGFFWIGLDRRKQGWHDKLARTFVMVDPSRRTWWQLIRDAFRFMRSR